jgi:hypothetical protein
MRFVAKSISNPCFQPLLFVLVLSPGIFAAACGGGDDDPDAQSADPTATTTSVLETAEPARFYAADAGDRSGAIATGDFNGDGETDVAIAAALADGEGNAAADAGEAYVFLGPFMPGDERDAAAGDQGLTVYGARAGDQTARSLVAGDFNGDGLDDLAIGSPFSDGPAGDRADAGRVDIVPGSRAIGTNDATAVALNEASAGTFYGATAGDFAGISLAVGRLNEDGIADLVVGAFWAAGPDDSRPMGGEVYALMGSPAFPASRDLATTAADVTIYGAQSEDRLGEGVATGDVNGDGADDLVLPAPFAENREGVADAGRTYVISSPPPPIADLATFIPLATVYGVDDGDQLGHVPVTGDFDGDGRADLLLTAVSADGPDNTIDLSGEAAIFLSKSLEGERTGAPGNADAIIYGEGQEDRLGRSAASGDLDGDGSDEVLLAAPGADSLDGGATAGRIYLLESSPLVAETRLPADSQIHYGADAGDALASSVYGRMPIVVADIDGDGRGEIVALAPLGDGPGNARKDCGEAVILFITRATPR